MTCSVTKDPDNNWFVFIDWSSWFDQLIDDVGGSFTITDSTWFPDAAITENGKKIDDTSKKTYFYGTGGVAGTKYNAVNRITYTSTALAPETFTEDRTIEIRIKNK